ncbi:hypothetical protein R3P38DRAFT_3271165 [Favolaschia claudopus]|uniref:F-box domain-containing protein n=1 Tax=Favolaschia claudopus TaxID=2862362 RepID=A0AAW0B8A9_9AGAR
MPLSQPKPDPYEVPMLFFRVSRLWTRIALATPALWARLRMERLPRKTGFSSLCDLWLTRASDSPLALTVHSSVSLDDTIRHFLARCGPRLSSLLVQLDLAQSYDKSVTRQIALNASFPLLRSMAIHSEEFILTADSNDRLELLRSSPALVEYTVQNILYRPDPDVPSYVQPLTHTSLQRLRLGRIWGEEGEGRGAENSATMLRYLTLPALKHLTLTHLDITPDDFISFVTRSSSPLESLHIMHQNLGDDLLMACFRVIPSLTHLLFGESYEQFIRILSMGSPHPLLPNLRHLTLVPGILLHTDCQAIARMLEVCCARIRTRLECFRLVHSRALDEDVLVDLRRLASEGLQVRFGKDDDKLLV